MKKYYLIYKITNQINNKIYIGAHETNDKNDSYMGSGAYLKRAQKKYGLNSFKKEILFECKSSDEMYQKEAEIVDEEFVARLDTYNLKVGGDGGWDYINSSSKKKTITSKGGIGKKKFLASLSKEDKDTYYAKIKILRNVLRELWSEEHKKEVSTNISNGLKEYYKNHVSANKGMKYSAETCKKLSENHKGNLNSQFGKMWICNDLTKESKSILKTDPIPNGWRKGRICKKPQHANGQSASLPNLI